MQYAILSLELYGSMANNYSNHFWGKTGVWKRSGILSSSRPGWQIRISKASMPHFQRLRRKVKRALPFVQFQLRPLDRGKLVYSTAIFTRRHPQLPAYFIAEGGNVIQKCTIDQQGVHRMLDLGLRSRSPWKGHNQRIGNSTQDLTLKDAGSFSSLYYPLPRSDHTLEVY